MGGGFIDLHPDLSGSSRLRRRRGASRGSGTHLLAHLGLDGRRGQSQGGQPAVGLRDWEGAVHRFGFGES